MKQTSAQRIASDPQISARVSANAGTGKTHILVNRFLRLLLSGSHPNKILCLTYTKAAAAEMSSRITSNLKRWVLVDEKKLQAELYDLLDRNATKEEVKRARELFTISLQSMPPPRIQTIHSFCQEILSRFPVEAKVPIKFNVIDELTAGEMLRDAKNILLSDMQNNEQLADAIMHIAKNSSETTFDNIIEDIRSNRNKLKRIIESSDLGYIEDVYTSLNVSRGISVEDTIDCVFNYDQAFLARLITGYANSSNEKDHEKADKLRAACDMREAWAYANIFLTKENKPTQLSRIARKDILQNDPELEDMIIVEQERLDDLIDQYNSLKIAQFTEAVLIVAIGFIKIYEDIKEKNAYLDYEDLIFYTSRLLQDSDSTAWVLYKLDGGIEHILLDEAQDTSPEQWQIINSITSEFFDGQTAFDDNRTVFIVGDEKQSIYSFQGADPASFGAVAGELAVKCINADKQWREVPLEKSFRSVGAVLNFVDKVFEKEEHRSSVSFNDKGIKHEINRLGQGGIVEVWPLEEQKEKEKFARWETPIIAFEGSDEQSVLAKKIAQTIRSWLDNGRQIAALGRAVKPSDIIILLRKRGKFADKIIRELKDKDIKVAGSDRLKIAEHIAVMDLMALGRFLLLPNDDYSLACVLKSPLFGVSENELFELCYGRGNSSLLSVVKNNSKYSELCNNLNALLDIVDYTSPYELYSIIMDKNQGRKKFLSRLGAEANDPINEFMQLALDFEKSHNNSLQEFLHWVDSGETQIKRDLENSSDQVRVMTVHASKGLQAPVVILPDTTSTPSGDNKSGNNVIWENDELFYSASSSSIYNKRLKALKEISKHKEYDEYLRLLYVALTRAGDEIYICGTQGKKKVPDDSWYNILKPELEELGQAEGEVIRFQTEQEAEIKADEEITEDIVIDALPSFAYNKAASEEVKTSREKGEVYDYEAIRYGLKIHKFLEFLELKKGDDIYQKALAYIGDEQRAKELVKIFDNEEIYNVFSSDAIPEASFAGNINGEYIEARIDRLIVSDDKVDVIEFKTSGKVYTKLPDSYKRQLQKYRSLVKTTFPDKKVVTKILWVNEARLQEVALDD